MEIAGTITGKIWDPLFDAFRHQLGYLIHYSDNVENFRKQTDKLGDMRKRVQGQIDAARRNGELVEADVQKWIEGVDNAIAEAERFLAAEDKANKRCLNVWGINLRSRYKFSRQAHKKTCAITELQIESKFQNVSRTPPRQGIILSSIKISGAFHSRRSIMKQVMEALVDENIHMIGICGMGGIGKTTMVKEIGKHAMENKLFDGVVMTVVSQTPNLAKIQDEFASFLGLKLNSPSELDRAGLLGQRIKQNRILVILDDVWEKIDLEKIGILFGNDHKGCKIVLTSRREDVFNQMHTQKNFTVEVLSKQESWNLFRETAGQAVDSVDINSIAREIVAKCDGLPSAILTVGSTLKNKSKEVWTNAARQLKESVPIYIQEIFGDVFSSLKLSYDYLKSKEAKSYFLLCCLFPEDSCVSVEELVRYGMGLRLIQDVRTLEDARGRAHASVSTLISSFLLLNTNMEGHIEMHNVVRQVAISIATKDKDGFLVKADVGLKEWPNINAFDNFTIISLMSNYISELPDELECPKLQALLLQGNVPLTNIPNNFFQKTKDLKILDISDHYISSSLLSISSLSELRTLHLNNCSYLREFSIIGKLKKLEILSLSGCHSLEEIPKQFSGLTKLRLFDINGCRELKHISPGVISSLHKLEELYAKNSFRNWGTTTRVEGSLTISGIICELIELPRLTNLDIQFLDAKILPDLKVFQNLLSYNIAIGNSPDPMLLDRGIVGLGSRSLSLTHDVKFPLLDWINNLVQRAQSLQLFDCKGLTNFFPDLDHVKFVELKYLELLGCYDMMYLLNTMEELRHLPLRSLESLHLRDLSNLCEICHGKLPAESFSNVRQILVRDCPKMSSIVPPKLLQRLQNLESFLAEDCDSLRYAFEIEGLVIEKEKTKFLSMLKVLYLGGLPEMTHIWKGSTQLISLCNLKFVQVVDCQNLGMLFPPVLVQDLMCLKELRIVSCHNLEEIFGKQEAREEGREMLVLEKDYNVVSCFNLTSVEISKCEELTILFTHSIAKCLLQLKTLRVKSCPKLQEVVSNEEQEGESTEKMVFPCLSSVKLFDLENLTSFFPGHHTIEWLALEELIIHSCPKMETFGKGLQLTPKLEKVQIDWSKQRWMGNLNDAVYHKFKEEQELARQQDAKRQENLKLPPQ